MPMPTYLYHATPKDNAAAIASDGLEPRSADDEGEPYLCMSGSENGARTLGGRANDIIFRVKCTNLDAGAWSARGAGDREWRSTQAVPANILQYRRNLGTASQTTWRGTVEYPIGT